MAAATQKKKSSRAKNTIYRCSSSDLDLFKNIYLYSLQAGEGEEEEEVGARAANRVVAALGLTGDIRITEKGLKKTI